MGSPNEVKNNLSTTEYLDQEPLLLKSPQATRLYISIKKNSKDNYIKILTDDPKIANIKYLYRDIANIIKFLGINIAISAPDTLLITKAPGLNKLAKTRQYIIDTDFNTLLQELYVDQIKLLNSPWVRYHYVWGNVIEIMGSKLVEAYKHGKMVAIQSLTLECLQINNIDGILKSPRFNLNSQIINNMNGIIYGICGTIIAKILNNHRGIISTANIKRKILTGLTLEALIKLIKRYIKQNIPAGGGSLALGVVKILNSECGMILSKQQLLIDSKAYNVSRALSIFDASHKVGLLNQGVIASLDAKATVNMIGDINNYAGGAILARKEVEVNSLGKVFRDPNSEILGSVTNVSGLELELENIKAYYLNLAAYRKASLPGAKIEHDLKIDVINGDNTYKNIACGGETVINQVARATKECGNFVYDPFKIYLISTMYFSSTTYQHTPTIVYDQKNNTITHLFIHDGKESKVFLLAELRQMPDFREVAEQHFNNFIQQNITKIKDPRDLFEYTCTEHNAVTRWLLSHSGHKWIVKARHGSTVIDNCESKDLKVNSDGLEVIKTRADSVVAKVTDGRFIYDHNALQANNYDLTMCSASDLKLPEQVHGDYGATVTDDGGQVVLSKDLTVDGKLRLQINGQQFVTNNQGLVKMHSGGRQDVEAKEILLGKIGFAANDGITLHAHNEFMVGEVPTAITDAAGYIRSAGPIKLISDTKPVWLVQTDVVSRSGENNKITVRSPEIFVGVSSNILATDKIHLQTPISKFSLIHKITGSENRTGNTQVLSKCVVNGRPTIVNAKELEVDGVVEVTGSHLGFNNLIGAAPLKMETVEAYEELRTYGQDTRKGDRKYGCCGPREDIPIVTTKDHKDIKATYQSKLSSYSDLDCDIPVQANYNGVIVGNQGANLRYHDLIVRNTDSLMVAKSNFAPIVVASSVVPASNFFQINPNQQFVFNPVFDLFGSIKEKNNLAIVVITKDGRILLDDQNKFTRLHHEQQEIESYPLFLKKHNDENVSSSHYNFEDLYWQARKNAIEQYHAMYKVAGTTNAGAVVKIAELMDLFKQITEAIIVYREIEYQDGSNKVEMVSLMPESKQDQLLTDKDNVSGIFTRTDLKMHGDQNSTLDCTGKIKSLEGNIAITADQDSSISLAKQQVSTRKTVADVESHSNLFGTKVTVNIREETELQTQSASGTLTAAGDITIHAATGSSVNLAGIDAVYGGEFDILADHITVIPSVDHTVETHTGSAKTKLKSAFVQKNLRRYSIKPAIFHGKKAKFHARKTGKYVAPKFNTPEMIKITVADGGNQTFEVIKVTKELAPNLFKKAQAIFSASGYSEQALSPVFTSEHVFLLGGDSIELYAPVFKSNDVKVIAKQVLIAAAKLKNQLNTTGSGLVAWNKYLTKYSELLLGENALCPIFHADFINIVATEGRVILESPVIQANNLEQTICEIEAKVDIIFKAVNLHRERTISKSGIGLKISSPLIDAAVKENTDPIINSLPLIANLKGLMGAECEGEAIGHGLLSFYHAYDAYKKTQSGDFGEYLRDQIFSISSSYQFEHKTTKTTNLDPRQSIINTGQFLLKAGNAVDLAAIKADVKRFFVKAKQLNMHSAVGGFNLSERTASLSVGATLNTSGVSITAALDQAKSSVDTTRHVTSTVNAESFEILVDDAVFRGAMVQAGNIFMEIAKSLTIDVPLDSLNSSTASTNIHGGYNIATGAVTVGGGVTSNSVEKQQVVATGLHATKTMCVTVGNKTVLNGGFLTVDSEAKPTIKAKFGGQTIDFYEIPVAPDGDCAFRSLGVIRGKVAEQLLEHCYRPEIARLIAQEFDCTWRESDYQVFTMQLPSSITNQLTQLDFDYTEESKSLNKFAEEMNDKYRPIIKRPSADEMLELLTNPSQELNLTATEQQELLARATVRDVAREALLKFLSTKEHCKIFIDLYLNNKDQELNKVFWLGFGKKNSGLMEAIALINNFNFRIWGYKKDENNIIIPGEVEYLYSFVGNSNSSDYREMFFKGNHFDILSTTPGIVSSKELEGNSVFSEATTTKEGFSVSNVPIGNSGKKDHLGAIATFNTGESTTTIEHKATIGSNITIVTESSLSGINRNSKQKEGAEHSEHTGIMIPIAMGLAKDLFSSKDKPDVLQAELMPKELDQQRDDLGQQIKPVQSEPVPEKSEQQNKPAQQDKRRQENTKNLVSSPKPRVTSQQEAPSQLIGSALATKTQPVSTALSNPNEQTTHRQANNLRWLEQLELFSGGLDHFTSQGQASNSWSNHDFDLESMTYNAQSKMILNLYQQHKVGTRVMGAMQAGVGIGQLGLSAALAETGVGVVPACLLAARGADNLVAGGMAFVTGQDTPTILHQAVRSTGLSNTAATWIEFGIDLSPAAPSMMKTGVLKLYDLRAARQPVISASTPAEIAWGTGKLSSRQNALLEALPSVGSELRLHKSMINTTDLAALTAYTGNEFAIFTRGSQRLVVHGDVTNMGLSVKQLKSFKEQGFKFSAHTHPTNTTLGRYVLDASGGDRLALEIFGQERSLILDSLGRRNIFDQTDNLSADILQSLRQVSNNLPRGPRP